MAQGLYLPRDAWRRLAVRHRNVSSASLEVRQVPNENLVFWLSEGSEAASERVANRVANRSFDLSGPPDAFATSWLDVAAVAPSTTSGPLELAGLYCTLARDGRYLPLRWQPAASRAVRTSGLQGAPQIS